VPVCDEKHQDCEMPRELGDDRSCNREFQHPDQHQCRACCSSWAYPPACERCGKTGREIHPIHTYEGPGPVEVFKVCGLCRYEMRS